MKKRLDDIKSKAIKLREKLSYNNPEQKEHITKMDRIIRGTSYVKWMLMISLALSIAYLIASIIFFYPKIEFMLAFSGIAVICFAVCLSSVAIQAKLYDRTINKTQELLDSGQ
jgi:uncharacterized membrane protein